MQLGTDKMVSMDMEESQLTWDYFKYKLLCPTRTQTLANHSSYNSIL